MFKATVKITHSGKNDSKNRPISIKTSFNISVGLKCLEKVIGKDQYCLKHQKRQDKTYETLHNVTRNHYKIPAKRKTYLGYYKGKVS